MRKHWFIALAFCAAFMITSAVAQDNANSNQQPAQGSEQSGQMRRRGHMDPQKQTEHLTKELKLNSDQQAKVLDILKTQQSQMQSLWSDSSASQDDKRSKMMDIHKQSSDQIRALLDPDQQKKFDEMQTERRHHDGMGPGATPN
jgi:periplasmic protein CpxP/Spy